MSRERVVIVGASHASAQLCASLRQQGWAGDILLIGDEPSLPYHRPPLSKAYLANESTLDELLIRKHDFYDKQGITFRQGRASAIDRGSRNLTMVDGEIIAYDALVLCVGARPRRLTLPGAELSGLHYLRDAGDTEAIRSTLSTVRQVAIIGAGYIGLETAASLRGLGVAVTVLEAADRVLRRVTAPEVSAFYDRVHREEGVDIRVGVQVAELVGRGSIEGVRLADGEIVAADLVIAGVGVLPNIELAEEAGLAVGDGIVIDAYGRTTDPFIFAAGDCAEYPDARYGCRLRLESVPNAVEQAKAVAATICGKEKSIAALPWFWSDQFDLKLQIVGLNAGYDETVLRGDPVSGRAFACFYLSGGRIIAADCVNRPQEFAFSKRAIAEGLHPERGGLSDVEASLSSLLEAPASV